MKPGGGARAGVTQALAPSGVLKGQSFAPAPVVHSTGPVLQRPQLTEVYVYSAAQAQDGSQAHDGPSQYLLMKLRSTSNRTRQQGGTARRKQ